MGWDTVIVTIPRHKGWHPFHSPLTRRILAVNLLAPALLVAGLFYLDRYQQGLIRTELAGLITQAEMVAGAVGEGAVTELDHGQVEINQSMAQHLVRRLAKPAQLRARLFDADGSLAADSRFLLRGPHGSIHMEPLEPPQPRGWQGRLSAFLEQIQTWMPVDSNLPLYQESPEDRAENWPEITQALEGRAKGMVRAAQSGGLVLSVAVPVQRYKQVVGAIMVSADGKAIAKSLFQVRLAILEAFILALAVTTLLSIYLASTIAQPIRRLSQAAHRVRKGRGRRVEIPDFSTRADEIGDLARDLKVMTDALWTRMDAIERFAADVAHEIKNPLSSVRSAVETLGRISDPDRQKKLLSIVQDDVIRLDRLISDISDASRIDAEMSRAESETVPIARLLESLGEIYGSTTNGTIRFRVALPANDPLPVQAVEGRLVQVLRNLIGNAISFSPEAGTILMGALRQDQHILISIEDDGPGIPDNKLEAIFDRFYSERPREEKFGTHSGLGLSISRQIIEALGGAIWAENKKDPDGQTIGARFLVRLAAA